MAELSTIELGQMQEGLTDQQKMLFMTQYNSDKKDRTIAMVISVFLGYLGVDRFYVGDTKSGIIKLITVGGCGIWYLVDWFLIMGVADEKNREKAKEIIYTIKPK